MTALEAFDLEMKSWTRYPCIPSRRAFSCCATNERSLFSLGGLQQPGPHNFYSRPHFVSTMEEYDLDQGKWSTVLRRLQHYLALTGFYLHLHISLSHQHLYRYIYTLYFIFPFVSKLQVQLYNNLLSSHDSTKTTSGKS